AGIELSAVIRDGANQQQDVTGLSRDAAHANQTLSPIFDKEKEQNRLATAQKTGEIGRQVSDVLVTQGKLNAQAAQSDPAARAAARAKLVAGGNGSPSEEQINAQVSRTATADYDTGGKYQKVAQAVTAAMQGLAGGDLAQAASGAVSPYVAEIIHSQTTDSATGKVNVEANAMAHAVWGAIAAASGNNSALAGAAGAVSGELLGRWIAAEYYPGVKTEELSEEQKSTISALSTLAAGLMGGLSGGSSADAVAGAQAGKNAVENNSLAGDESRKSVKESAEWWKTQVRDKLGEGTTSSIANGIINALADTSDAALGSADYVADAAMALASCAAGDSYCSRAMSDLAGKNQAVADSVAALMKSETWSAVADTVKQAAGGNQAALEATGGMLAGIMLPGKKLPNVVKAVDPTIKIATGQAVGAFEKSLVSLPPGERVAIIKQTAPKVAAENGMVKDNRLTQMNGGREVYKDQDGNLYALDTQHARFEVLTPKGKHLGEVDFSMQKIPNSQDKSGGHNLKVK
ncbi:VENN motif pre-toxin domain-containing protein, partial [Klebsiella sp. K-Nf6]|uniref:VENN motif pre-toxin domain-containing protein n=1 Tax=Klebsiella sp. K-Nf6 TaxID=2054595 RepID=UPI00197DCD40